MFGINDSEKKIVGLTKNITDIIKDANNVHQKINRHLEPNIIGLRAKEFKIGDHSIVIIYIPQSVGITHMISKEGVFDHPSGKPKTLLQKGTIYVRRSAGNHLADSRDLSDIIERRIDQFRDALLEKVAKVVHAPASSDVFILSKDKGDKEAKRFIIEDSPDAIAIKGMSFTVALKGLNKKLLRGRFRRGNPSQYLHLSFCGDGMLIEVKLMLARNINLLYFNFLYGVKYQPFTGLKR